MPPVFYVAIFRAYIDCFKHEMIVPRDKNQWMVADKYAIELEDDIWDRIAQLDNDPTKIDTGLEVVLALYDSAAVQAIRPAKAEEVLPHNRASEIKLAGAIFQYLQEIKFLDPQNRTRIGNYETELKFRTDKNKITQAELNAALRASISAAVDEEFNKISFMMSNNSIKKGYSVVLTRTANNQYILEYDGVYQGKNFYEKLPPASLETLLSEMRKNTTDFDQSCINAVRAQAALIPAVARPAELNAVKQALVNFYTNPSQQTYKGLKDLYLQYVSVAGLAIKDGAVYGSFLDTVSALSTELYNRIQR